MCLLLAFCINLRQNLLPEKSLTYLWKSGFPCLEQPGPNYVFSIRERSLCFVKNKAGLFSPPDLVAELFLIFRFLPVDCFTWSIAYWALRERSLNSVKYMRTLSAVVLKLTRTFSLVIVYFYCVLLSTGNLNNLSYIILVNINKKDCRLRPA